VRRGRETVERQIVTARGTGQLVVAFGVPMLKQRITSLIDRSSSAPTVAPQPEPKAPQATEAPEPGPTVAAAPAAETLPIAAYDELSASQVVEHLDGLGAAELAAVRAYETVHRGRRTILGRIEQLAG
ncbi:MAG: hypothetical protein ACKOOG_04230, partial [Actinomycetota bacterium]